MEPPVDAPVDPKDLVDLDRYPVSDPPGPVLRAVVADARAQLCDTGAVELPGFLHAAGVRAMVDDADSLAPRAHHSAGEGTAYLEYPDFGLPDGHPG